MNIPKQSKIRFDIDRLEERIAPAHLAVHTVSFPSEANVPDAAPIPGPTPVSDVCHRVKFDNTKGIIAILIG